MKFKEIVYLFLTTTMFNTTTFTLSQAQTEEVILEGQQTEASELLERLQTLRRHPMDLNRISLQILLPLPLLSPIQVRNLIQDRNKRGRFDSWKDLENRLNFSSDIIETLQVYFIILSSKPQNHEFLNMRWRFQRRKPDSYAYKKNIYSGSPWKSYQRIKIQFTQNIRSAILLEKDAGEIKWNDHLVGFLEFNRLPHQFRLLFGNYQFESGQGLVFWSPYGLFKGASILAPIKKEPRGGVGYVYSEETRYLTGGVIETLLKGFRFSLFTSRRYLDATLNANGTVRTILSSGLHRTKSEISKSGQLKEILYGMRIAINRSWGRIGITGWTNHYTRRIKKQNINRHYFEFQGDRNSVLGFEFNLYFPYGNFFGEVARSKSGGVACICNCILEFEKHNFVFSYRRYDPDFHNPHAHSFGSDDVSNTEGFYIGCSIRFMKTTRFSFYYDQFRKPWRTYTFPVPTCGDDILAELQQKISSYLSLIFRVRWRRGEELSETQSSDGHKISILQDGNSRRLRFEARYKLFPNLQCKVRYESVALQNTDSTITSPSNHREKGMLFYTDLLFRPYPTITLLTRWMTFDTYSFSSRCYAFEGDLTGVLSVPPFYGKGTRYYFLIRWSVQKQIQLSAKLSFTYHDGVSSWGSGLDRLNSNTMKHVGLQADLNF